MLRRQKTMAAWRVSLFSSCLMCRESENLADLVDIVEVRNGRSDNQVNQRAMQLCETLGAAPGAGSDAHMLNEVGAVYIEMEKFDGAQDFLAKLCRGKITGRRSGSCFDSRSGPTGRVAFAWGCSARH
jgi:hypothetical protein